MPPLTVIVTSFRSGPVAGTGDRLPEAGAGAGADADADGEAGGVEDSGEGEPGVAVAVGTAEAPGFAESPPPPEEQPPRPSTPAAHTTAATTPAVPLPSTALLRPADRLNRTVRTTEPHLGAVRNRCPSSGQPFRTPQSVLIGT
jgi:hypothetical protein